MSKTKFFTGHYDEGRTTRVVNIRMTPEQHEQYKQQAKNRGSTLSDCVRDALDQYFATGE